MYPTLSQNSITLTRTLAGFPVDTPINHKQSPMSKLLSLFVALMVGLGMCVGLQAQTLTSSISHLPIPTPNPGIPAGSVVDPLLASVPGGFTGTWSSPAHPNWIGTFSATGPIPTGSTNPAGTTVYDFTSLHTGVLPVGSILRFSDLDLGSSSIEQFTLTGTCGTCSAPLGFFLDEPFGVVDTIDGNPIPAEMPGVTVLGSAPNVTYRFNGFTVTTVNPSIVFGLMNNQPLTTLTVVRASPFASFSIAAPVIPEPASAALMGIGSLLLMARRKTDAD